MTSSKTSYEGHAENLPRARLAPALTALPLPRWAAAALLPVWWLISSSPAAAAGAGELEISGSVGIEARLFVNQPAFPGQLQGLQLSLIAEPALRYETEGGRQQFSLVPFLRLDSRDDERTHLDLREGYWRYIGSDWELLAGVNRVFWGVTESRHLVDILNQDDAVEDIDGEDKLGQPMVELVLLRNWGTMSFYLLPLFRERTFPGRDGRLRTPLPVDTDHPIYESSAGDGHVDAAVRYSHFLGNWDLGLYYFNGTSREPILLPEADGERLIPFYSLIEQIGLDLQYTRGAWLWKLEGIVRSGQGPTFGAAVAGFEYTLYQLAGGAADLGLLFEYLHDDRDPFEAPPTIFDDDLFVGSRLALNDTQDTSVLAGLVIDRQDGSTAALIEAERRIGSRWKVELESRLFFDVAKTNPLATFQADDFLTVRMSRYF
jgi:hypothetical protein